LTVVLLPGELEVEQRRLSDYDLALGLGEAEVVAG
jgi:hypothetical protein